MLAAAAGAVAWEPLAFQQQQSCSSSLLAGDGLLVIALTVWPGDMFTLFPGKGHGGDTE